MGLFSKPLYKQDVHFYGPVGKKDAPTEPIRGWVDAEPNPPQILEDRTAEAFLLPLLAGYHILIAVKARPAIVPAYIGWLEWAANEGLRGEAQARDLNLVGYLEDVEMPTLAEQSEGKGKRVLKTALTISGDEIVSRSRAPLKGGGYFAPAGHLLMLLSAARRAPYEETLVPTFYGLKVAARLYEIGAEYITGPGEWIEPFNSGVRSMVSSSDPRAEWDRRMAESSSPPEPSPGPPEAPQAPEAPEPPREQAKVEETLADLERKYGN